MRPLFFIGTAVFSCPAIGIFLLVGWRASWLGRYPSLPWMLAAMLFSLGCVFGLRILEKGRGSEANLSELPELTGAYEAADKVKAALVAIGILWMLFLGLSTVETLKMSRATGVVETVEKGRAQVTFENRHRGYDFPEFDSFLKLKAGQTVTVLHQWKTTEIAYRTCAFTILGAANGAVLILGGLFASGSIALKFPSRSRLSG